MFVKWVKGTHIDYLIHATYNERCVLIASVSDAEKINKCMRTQLSGQVTCECGVTVNELTSQIPAAFW